MIMNDYEKIMKELEKEYDTNVETIKELGKKIEIVNSNKFSSSVDRSSDTAGRMAAVIIFSLLPMVYKGLLSANILSLLIIGVLPTTCILSQVRNNILYKKSMRKFCDARTEIEKIEAETNLTIEKENLNNKNKILRKKINRFKELIETNDKSDLSYNSEMIEENDLKESQNVEKLKEQYNKINILTKRKVLSNEFLMIRKLTKKIVIRTIIIGGGYIALPAGFPFIIEAMMLNNSAPSIIKLICTMLIGFTAEGIYSLKNYSNLKKAFDNINETLGENALTEYENLEEELSNYDNDLEAAISLAADIELDVELEKVCSKGQENSENSIQQPLTLNNVYDNSIAQKPKVKVATLRRHS